MRTPSSIEGSLIVLRPDAGLLPTTVVAPGEADETDGRRTRLAMLTTPLT
jgi:hypothetical protein